MESERHMEEKQNSPQNQEYQSGQEAKPVQGSWKMRLRAVIVLAGVSALIGASIYLDPANLEDIHGHHYKLLKPCSFLVKTGYPCPTCYMTRAFSYMFHGRPDKSFLAQPFGALLSLMVVYLGYGAVTVLISGRPWRAAWAKWPRWRILAVFIALFLAGWIFRILYGTFITHEFPFKM
jgi:hypothetical protein